MKFLGLFIIGLLVSLSLEAHTESGVIGGFVSGFLHPILGWDHVIAMVAVGLWGAYLGQPGIWLLPVVFPLMMAFGGVLGVLGLPLPGVEYGIAISAIVLGVAVAIKFKADIKIALLLVGVFALFHGHAHGVEQPNSADPMAYSIGFVLATGLMHLVGIAFGYFTKFKWGDKLVRLLGVLIALLGLLRLFGVL